MAVAAVNDDSTDEQVEAATQAIADARVAIAETTDVPAEEKAANTGTVGEIMAQLSTAKESRMAAMEAADKADEAERMAMAATAAKLYAGIGAPNADAGAEELSAAYDSGGNMVEIKIGEATAVNLSEDKKTMVYANHGWEGKRYTRTTPAGEGTYEAVVFSNVEAMKEGRKFGSTATVSPTGAFEYMLTTGRGVHHQHAC